MAAAHHRLDDLALDVRERITQQRQTERPGVNRDPTELVAAGSGELLRELALILAEHVDDVAVRRRHGLGGGHRVVDTSEHQRRFHRQRRDGAGGHAVTPGSCLGGHDGHPAGEMPDHVPEAGRVNRRCRSGADRLHSATLRWPSGRAPTPGAVPRTGDLIEQSLAGQRTHASRQFAPSRVPAGVRRSRAPIRHGPLGPD